MLGASIPLRWLDFGFFLNHEWCMSVRGRAKIDWKIISLTSYSNEYENTNQYRLSRLVDWLRVPTPMRAIRVRAWVEVVGSVMKKFISEFNEMPEIFWRHLAWKAESSLSEDELSCKVLGPAVYTKIYCRVQWNRVLFIPVQWENRVTLTMKRIEAGRQFPMIKQLPWQLAVNRGAVGESRTSGRRGKIIIPINITQSDWHNFNQILIISQLFLSHSSMLS